MMMAVMNLLKERVAIAKVGSDNADYLIDISIKEAEEGIAELEEKDGPGQSGLGNGGRLTIIRSLSWMVAEAKQRFNDCRNNLEEGSEGGYDPRLTKAIGLLDALVKGTELPDEDAVVTAYLQGFEDCKKQITEGIHKLVR